MAYIISTDSGANLPDEILKERNIIMSPLTIQIDGVSNRITSLSEFDGEGFYKTIRDKDVKTSTVNLQEFCEKWEPYLEQGLDILHVSLSSGVSSSYQAAVMAADMLMEDYEDRKILVYDTHGAGLGEGMQVLEASDLNAAGVDIEAAFEKLNERRDNVRQIFTVDDLYYLKKGGRLSSASAFVGSMLQIKPVLIGSEEGTIVAISKERGRKNALKAIIKEYEEKADKSCQNYVCINHILCDEDTQMILNEIERITPGQKVLSVMFEPVMGSHVGPGSLALFYRKAE